MYLVIINCLCYLRLEKTLELTYFRNNNTILFWFQHFFANRDYVFKRRFAFDEENQEAVIMSRAIDSNEFPEEKGIYRVNEYWSTMVIRACESIDKVGRKLLCLCVFFHGCCDDMTGVFCFLFKVEKKSNIRVN